MSHHDRKNADCVFLPMLEIDQQPALHGRVITVSTQKDQSPITAVAAEQFPKVARVTDRATLDGLLDAFQPEALLGKIRDLIAVRLSEKLLTQDGTPAWQLFRDIKSDHRIELSARLKEGVRSALEAPVRQLREPLTRAVEHGDSHVLQTVNWIERSLDSPQLPNASEEARSHFENRGKQLLRVRGLRSQLKAETYARLESRLRGDYDASFETACDELSVDLLINGLPSLRRDVQTACEQVRHQCRRWVAKMQDVRETLQARHATALERSQAQAVPHIFVVPEASPDEVTASLMERFDANDEGEMIDGLRHELTNRLRKLANLHDSGDQAGALGRLLWKTDTATLANVFTDLIAECVSGRHSFYETLEKTVGGPERVEEAEKKLDGLFEQRAQRNLTQALIVKRWGKAVAQLVARFSKNPNVDVFDAGQLAVRTATFVPSAQVKSVTWAVPERLLARIAIDVSVDIRTSIDLPADTVLTVSCPLSGHRWVSSPVLQVGKGARVLSCILEIPIDAGDWCRADAYDVPLHIAAPKRIRTAQGVLFATVAPPRLRCRFPVSALRPAVSINAELVANGESRWLDFGKRIAAFPVRLRLVPNIAFGRGRAAARASPHGYGTRVVFVLNAGHGVDSVARHALRP